MARSHSYRHKTAWPHTLALLLVAVLLVWLVIVLYSRRASAAPASPASSASVNVNELLLVETSPAQPGCIVDYDAFRVNFNPDCHIPNWVSWELTADETSGSFSRSKFQQDPSVSGCPKPADYTGSGYDRGHMAPAADMKWSDEAMARCFYMTNICPQAHSLNGGTWKKLEEKCRLWAQADSAIIIVCGPILTPEPDEYIGATEVAVPRAFFKVICSPYANPPRGIGFIMPNGKVNGGLQAAAVSIDEVELLTGHDFFAALPDDIENAIEAECKFHYWSTLKPRK